MIDRNARHYRKMAVLARKQLAAIDTRLAAEGGKWHEFLFKIRHARLKGMLTRALHEKESRLGEEAILELIEELKEIGENEERWGDVSKEETDYIRFVLHGIKQSPPAKSGKEER